MAASAGDPRELGYVLPALAVAIVDGRGVVLRWSGEAERVLGHRAADVIGRPFHELVHGPRSAAGDPAGLPRPGRVRLGDGGLDADLWVIPLTGGSRDVLVVFAPADRTTEWGRGVSLLRALFGQEHLGFAIHAEDLSVVMNNRTPEMFGGAGVEEGARLSSVIRAEDAQETEAVLRRVIETGEPVIAHQQRVRFLQPPQAERLLSVTAVRLEDARHATTGVAAVVDDVTGQERVRAHRDLLHRAAARIGFSLSAHHTAAELAEVVVDGFADLATVDLADAVLTGEEPPAAGGNGQSDMVRVATASATGDWPAGLLNVGEPYPFIPDSGALRRLQGGRSFVLTREDVVRALGDEGLAAVLVPDGARSLIVSPLFARGLLLGSVTAWRVDEPYVFDRAEVELLAEISSRAALGVDNARRYTREHHAAVALQERLLPTAGTDTAAALTAGAYRPAGGGAGVSGDWFDVIDLPSLRVAFVVGDVVGHGLAAAAMMGRLRTAVQTFADLELEPDEILARLDDLVRRLAAETPPDRRDSVGAAVLIGVYDPTTCRCVFASAGSPQPVVLRPDGSILPVEVAPGPPLGVGGVPFQATAVEVEPGSVLALFTDGLLALDRQGGDHMGRLRDGLAAYRLGGRNLDEVGKAMIAGSNGRAPRDDIALLLSRTRAVKPESIEAWELPADPESVARARALTADALTTWGLDDLAFTTELVVSELITNAIRYGGGPIRMRLIRDEVLVCEIADQSNTQPRLLRAGVTDEGGRGLFIVSQCTTRWGCRYGRQGKTIWTEQPLTGAAEQVAPVFDTV